MLESIKEQTKSSKSIRKTNPFRRESILKRVCILVLTLTSLSKKIANSKSDCLNQNYRVGRTVQGVFQNLDKVQLETRDLL